MDIDAGQQRCAAVETHVLGLEDIAHLDQAALKLAVEQQAGADTGRKVEHTAHVDFGGYRGPVVGTAVYNLIFGLLFSRAETTFLMFSVQWIPGPRSMIEADTSKRSFS